MCGASGETPSAPRAELHIILDGLTNDNKEQILSALRDAANRCPACILAALRSHPKTTFNSVCLDDQMNIIGLSFKFKEEAAAWWSERQEIADRRYHYDQ